MSRRRRADPAPWEALVGLLGGWEDRSGHLRAAKRELLLFLREAIERELAAMERGRVRPRRPSPRRQRVPVRRVKAG